MIHFMLELKQLNKLTTSEETLVNYILKSPEKVIHQSPKELAKQSYVSVSTIYRLINKLNLEGLNALKLALVNELNAKKQGSFIDIDFPVSPEDTHYEVTQKLQVVYEQTLQATARINAIEQFTQTSNLLQTASCVDIYTSSANIYFAKNFQFQMQEIGKQVNVPIDDYMQRLTAVNSTKNHLAIIVSFAGRGSTAEQVFDMLEQNNSPILLITSENSPLLRRSVAGVCLFSSLENHYNKLSSFSTRMSLMYIFDMLYLNYFNQNYEKNLDYKLASYKKMNPSLT